MDIAKIMAEAQSESSRRQERREAIYARVGPRHAVFYKMLLESHDALFNIVQLIRAPREMQRELGPLFSASITQAMFDAASELLLAPSAPQTEVSKLRDDLLAVLEMESTALRAILNRVNS